MKNYLLIAMAIFLSIMVNAQSNIITIDNDIRLLRDSIENSQLLSDINSFLRSNMIKGEENQWILPSEVIETKILLGDIANIHKQDSLNRIRPLLSNIEPFSDKLSYSIQISYVSVFDNKASLVGLFSFIAHKKDNKFLFSSPLRRNTKDWHTKKVDYLLYYYQNISAENYVSENAKYTLKFDKQLGIRKSGSYYLCDDRESLTQILQLLGIQYLKSYNGFDWNSLGYSVDGEEIVLYTQRLSRSKNYDPHDTYHSRVKIAITTDKQNYYMICGGSSYFSSCWGMNWEEIKQLFKEKMMKKNNDWLELYFQRYNFGKSKREYIFVTSFINGLIIDKIYKEQGFNSVKELYSSGNMYENREHFFKVLESITAINEKNFNTKVGKLITNSMNNIETTNR